MTGPQDMTLSPEAGPKGLSLFLADLASYFRSEITTRGGDVVVPRFLAKLLQLGLGEAADRAEVFEETLRVAEANERRQRVLLAEIDALRQRIVLLGEIPAPEDPFRPADTVDWSLREAFRREHSGRQAPPTGGVS